MASKWKANGERSEKGLLKQAGCGQRRMSEVTQADNGSAVCRFTVPRGRRKAANTENGGKRSRPYIAADAEDLSLNLLVELQPTTYSSSCYSA